MAHLTDGELLDRFEFYAMQVEAQLLRGDDFDTLGNDIPFAVHLNDAKTLEVMHTNNTHAELTGHHIDEVREMGWAFLEKCVHPDSLAILPKYLPAAYEKDPSHSFRFVQYLLLRKPSVGFAPVITFTKPTKMANGLVICLSPLPKDFGRMSKKMERVVEMDRFKLKHFKCFQQLTGRETEVLQLLANGDNNRQIANKLCISRETVETHRKKLKAKLVLRSFGDLMKYALAFDLVRF